MDHAGEASPRSNRRLAGSGRSARPATNASPPRRCTTNTRTTTGRSAIPHFSCDEVAGGLFQGEFPEAGVDLGQFDVVVSMSIERPTAQMKPGALWLHVPIFDGEMEDPDGVREAALTVAEHVSAGSCVLVHCLAGLNRSGVVSARALMFMNVPVDAAIDAVRAARGPSALFNGHFVEWLYEEAGRPTLPDLGDGTA
jgi:hypothetical protein